MKPKTLVKSIHSANFFNKVFEVVRHIPFGKVTTYGAIAKFIGSGISARMVGWALNKSFSHCRQVPAHRVVNRCGMLTGKFYFSGSNVMKELLENEGIQVIDDCVQNFEKHFWKPGKDIIKKMNNPHSISNATDSQIELLISRV